MYASVVSHLPCIVMHPRGDAGQARRGLADIVDTENIEYWMQDGLEELEQVA